LGDAPEPSIWIAAGPAKTVGRPHR
jgi:hypothetical protein